MDLVQDVIGVTGAAHAVPHLHHRDLGAQAGLTLHLLRCLVSESGVVERVQLVGDVFANEVPEHLVQEGVRLQEVGEPLSGPTQEFTILLRHDGHLEFFSSVHLG